MRLKNIHGRLVPKNVNPYRIQWDKPSRSKLQFAVKQFFKPYWKNYIVYEEFPVYGSLLKVDFINATKRIAVEVQGDQHNEFNPFFHNNSREVYRRSLKRDTQKFEWLESNDFKIIEINSDEVPNLTLKFFEEKFGISIL